MILLKTEDSGPIAFGETRDVVYGGGRIRIEARSRNDASSGRIVSGIADILAACLTEEELKAAAAGERVSIRLVAKPLSDVPQEDKDRIETALGVIAERPLALGGYMDLTVKKQAGKEGWQCWLC